MKMLLSKEGDLNNMLLGNDSMIVPSNAIDSLVIFEFYYCDNESV